MNKRQVRDRKKKYWYGRNATRKFTVAKGKRENRIGDISSDREQKTVRGGRRGGKN